MKKSYYTEDGYYMDITTGKKYLPKRYCEICGTFHWLTVHHRLSQNKCIRDLQSKIKTPKTWTQEFINENQKLFTVCLNCHANIHANSDNFWQKYNLNKKEYIM